MATTSLGIGACHPADTPVRLTFETRSSHTTDPLLSFYVSDLSVIDAQGHAVPVRLDTNPWQNDATALVALGGRTENPVISGNVPDGRYVAVEFLLGIPFDRNHGNPLVAAPPLNVPSMFWSWQSGYKFVRLDMGNDWSFHLGATGCVSASAVRPPGEPCRQPNIARIRLAGGVTGTGTIVVDLDTLVANVDITTADNCMDSYANRPHCGGLLTNLGMSPDEGRCIDGCAGQTMFRFAGAESP